MYCKVKFVNYLCICTRFVRLNVSCQDRSLFLSNVSCLYHLRPPSRGTTGVVSIGPWVEKGSPN